MSVDAVARGSRPVALALVALTGLALALRLTAVGARLSDAEGYSWFVGAAPTGHAFLGRLAAYENTPPFYLLLHLGPRASPSALRWPALVAGVLAVPVLFGVVARPFGTRAGLLAALALAVAPYHVSYSDYSRGFMLAGLGALVALLAAVRLASAASRRWWWVYGGGATVGLWSEYDVALVLLAILGILLALGVPRRRDVLAFGVLPFLTLAPWVPQALRGLHAVGHTKLAPVFPGPSPASGRDLVASLAFGEHGVAGSPALRWAQALVLVGVLAILAHFAWRFAGRRRRAACARLGGARPPAWPGVRATARTRHAGAAHRASARGANELRGGRLRASRPRPGAARPPLRPRPGSDRRVSPAVRRARRPARPRGRAAGAGRGKRAGSGRCA